MINYIQLSLHITCQVQSITCGDKERVSDFLKRIRCIQAGVILSLILIQSIVFLTKWEAQAVRLLAKYLYYNQEVYFIFSLKKKKKVLSLRDLT